MAACDAAWQNAKFCHHCHQISVLRPKAATENSCETVGRLTHCFGATSAAMTQVVAPTDASTRSSCMVEERGRFSASTEDVHMHLKRQVAT